MYCKYSLSKTAIGMLNVVGWAAISFNLVFFCVLFCSFFLFKFYCITAFFGIRWYFSSEDCLCRHETLSNDRGLVLISF